MYFRRLLYLNSGMEQSGQLARPITSRSVVQIYFPLFCLEVDLNKFKLARNYYWFIDLMYLGLLHIFSFPFYFPIFA